MENLRVIEAKDIMECRRLGVKGVCTMYGKDLEETWMGVELLMMNEQANPDRLPYVVQTSLGQTLLKVEFENVIHYSLNRKRAGELSCIKVVNVVMFDDEGRKEEWEREGYLIKERESLKFKY